MDINIFPNPFSGKIIIDNAASIPLSEYRLFSIYGEMVKSGKLSSNRNEISTSDLPSGAYYLNIIGKEGGLQIEKLIKN